MTCSSWLPNWYSTNMLMPMWKMLPCTKPDVIQRQGSCSLSGGNNPYVNCQRAQTR